MRFLKVWVLTIVLLCSTVIPVSAWECGAISDTGAWGIGRSYSRSQAKSIAMHECRMRTPNWGTCWIDYCW